MVTIVNYGVGNITSFQNMFKRIGVEVVVTNEVSLIESATKIILPGVGAFDTCADMLAKSGLVQLLKKKAIQDCVPVLGVCVGMQLLFEGSDEGLLPGLGWIKGRVVKFDSSVFDKGLKIPNMGWTDVQIKKPSLLLKDMYSDPRFYFVHSYHAVATEPEDILLEADHGYTFTAAVQKNHIAGVQFHPEKSHKYGMKLLENFAYHFK
jgi:glutamine amidotransferase